MASSVAVAAAAADMDRAASAGSIAANEHGDDGAAGIGDVASPTAAIVPFTGAAWEARATGVEDPLLSPARQTSAWLTSSTSSFTVTSALWPIPCDAVCPGCVCGISLRPACCIVAKSGCAKGCGSGGEGGGAGAQPWLTLQHVGLTHPFTICCFWPCCCCKLCTWQ